MEKKLWAEAASTAVYLINMSPNVSLRFQIPEEVWSGSKVDYSHLRRLGCVAYVHRREDKLDPRAVKGFFVGYPEGTKGYRVWLPEEERCTISRNVVFDEEKLYKDPGQMEAANSKKKKKVTFSTDLIQGPTTSGSVHESTGKVEKLQEVGNLLVKVEILREVHNHKLNHKRNLRKKRRKIRTKMSLFMIICWQETGKGESSDHHRGLKDLIL